MVNYNDPRNYPGQLPKKRSKAKLIAAGVVGTLALGATGVGLWAHSVAKDFDNNRQIIQVHQPVIEEALDLSKNDPNTDNVAAMPKGSLNVLLMGTDRVDEASGGSRSDTIMVLNISEDRQDATLMSIPRDLYTEIPGYGFDRINAAYQHGGPALSKATIESLLDIDIDHVVMVDFAGFANLTTALGGVTINNPDEFTTTAKKGEPITYAAGEITLEGDEALWYVRERKAFADSDFSRVRHQQIFLKATMHQMLSEIKSNPTKISTIMHELLPYMKMDEELDSAAVVGYAKDLRSLNPGSIDSFTLPANIPIYTETGAQVLSIDETDLTAVQDAFSGDTVAEYAESANPAAGTQ